MKISFIAAVLALPLLIVAEETKWVSGGEKIWTKLAYLPKEVKEFMTFHEEFLARTENKFGLDYCQFDTTGRGKKKNDLRSVMDMIDMDLATRFHKDLEDVYYQTDHDPGMLSVVADDDTKPDPRMGKINHEIILPVKGTRKFVSMGMGNDFRLEEKCVDLCRSCATTAVNFGSNWMYCNRVLWATYNKKKNDRESYPYCHVTYGHNEKHPGRNETNDYEN